MLQQELIRTTRSAEKIDKVARYGWEPAKGHGELRSLDKRLLNVDRENYQRTRNEKKVLDVARAFSWIAFGALTVAEREDGSLWIVDGQHRHEGAMKRNDVTMVPCVVYRVEALKEEAQGFLDINVGRKPLTTADTHKARVATGDPDSLLLEEIATRHGYRVGAGHQPDSLRCVGVCTSYLKRRRMAFLDAFPVAAEICRGRPLDERVISALTYLQDQTGFLDQAVWRRAILAMGFQKIRDATDRAAAFYAKGGERVWATGLVEALNHGRRSNRLRLKEE